MEFHNNLLVITVRGDKGSGTGPEIFIFKVYLVKQENVDLGSSIENVTLFFFIFHMQRKLSTSAQKIHQLSS